MSQTQGLKQLSRRQLGRNGPIVSAMGLGTMGIGAFYGKTDEKEALSTLTYAADRGMTFWDTADIYGSTEKTLGKWFAQTGRRSDIFLATKFGAQELDEEDHMLGHVSSQPSYIKIALQRSLVRLQTDYIDLYYQHGVDPAVPIEVVLETLRPYVENKTIKWLGIGEVSLETLKRAKAVPGLGDKVIAAQIEFSTFSLDFEQRGLIPALEEAGVALVAYSPLSRGLVTGKYRSRADFDTDDFRLQLPRFSEENFPKNLALVDKLQALADKYNATTSQVALAWIYAEHPDSFPIPGCRSIQRVEENAAAVDLRLTPEDVKAIRVLCENVQGDRYPEWLMQQNGDSLSLSEWKNE